jgi:hypothetical protein
MADQARVMWVATERRWELEKEMIRRLCLPLKLAGNGRHPFGSVLGALNRNVGQAASSLPVADRGGPRKPRSPP